MKDKADRKDFYHIEYLYFSQPRTPGHARVADTETKTWSSRPSVATAKQQAVCALFREDQGGEEA